MLALSISATLNIVLGTQFATSLLVNDQVPETSMMVPGIPEMVAASAQGLSREDADILSKLVSSKEPMLLPAQVAYHRSLVSAISIIGQPHLNREKLRAAIDDARARQMHVDDLALETVREALERFSPEARLKIARQFSLR
ncbi:periplasmic heavy metal sensor [Bradyrhizobium sp. RDT10]